MTDLVLYWTAKSAVWCMQALPLGVLARFGRLAGALAWRLDLRHRQVALENLEAALGKNLTAAERQRLAKEHFKRLGENYCCAVKTAAMTDHQLRRHLEIVGREKLRGDDEQLRSAVFAVGHFGNFELYTRGTVALPGFQFATTYRALKQPGLNRVLLELRQRSGCWLFERRVDGDALRAAMSHQNLVLGFLSDQHAGRHGARLPFFGRDCATTTAPAVFALRYKLPLFTAICYRTAPARWRIEIGDEIATMHEGRRRNPEELMLEVNRAFEGAIRRDPANWFWVHKRWKPLGSTGAAARPVQNTATALP